VQSGADGVGEQDVVGRVRGGGPVREGVLRIRRRYARLEPVQTEPDRDGRQPGGQVVDVGVGAVQAQPRLLGDVLGLGVVAEDASGQADEAGALGAEGIGDGRLDAVGLGDGRLLGSRVRRLPHAHLTSRASGM
jgi:hypothetical protein